MMRWIIGWSIGLRYLILVLAGALIVFGITQIQDMSVDVFPEFDPPLVEVQTEALGLSAAEMEALITVPLEADLLNGVAWLDQIYSETVVGLSSILLVFEPGTDPIRARQMVQERLTETFALPNVSKPPSMLQPLSTTNRVMMVGLSSDEMSLIDIGVLARWNLKPRLTGIPGVANVAVWGQRERQLQVQVDPERLRDSGVALEQVIATTGEALWASPLNYLESSSPGTSGWIDTPNQRLSLRHELPISSAEDLARVPVKGTAWILSDVATVVEDHQPLIGDSILEDGPGLLLVIEKFPGANTMEVTRRVEETLEAMQPGLTGLDMDTTVFRPANYLELAASNLSTALLVGAVLAVIVLGVFFFEWRGVLISVLSIAISILAAIFILYLMGSTFNLMILAGLIVGLGIVVDDAIIGTENIMRRMRERTADQSTISLITEALIEMRSPIGFATLMIMLTILPVFLLEGLAAAFFEPLLVSYAIALLVSFVIALLITPGLSAAFLAGGSIRRDPSPVVSWLQSVYTRILGRVVRAAYPALAVAIALVLIGLLMVPFLETSLFPPLQKTELRIQWEGAPGTSRGSMARITEQASNELRAISGVQNVGSHIGRAITGDEVVGINSGEIWISLDPSADHEATVTAINSVIASYPGLFRDVDSYQPERLDQALSRPDQDIVVRVYGHEFDVLRSKAEEVSQALSGIEGFSNVQVESIVEEPQVEIEVDLAKAERFQVKPGDIRRAAATLLSGLQVGNLYEEQKVFDVVVWGVPEIRSNLSDIENLLIDTPRGGHVRLNEVADIRISPSPITIRRDAVSRFIDVGGQVSGRGLAAVAADVEERLQGITFPLEYHAEVLSQAAEDRAVQQGIIFTSLVALAGVVLLFQAVSRSWRLAFVTVLTLPVALVGGVLAVVLSGGIISFGSIFSLLALLAIALRNAVVMTHHFQQLEKTEGEPFGPELVLRGARERLSPIMMTAFIVGVVLLPLAAMGDVAGNEVFRPMAVVLLGGLVTTLLLGLLIFPPLYLRFGKVSVPESSEQPASAQPGLSTSAD